MGEKKRMREGFSLIEMIIAIAIVAIVMSAILVLLSYSTNMMRRTNNSVSLQNQSKDAMLHITTHLQEGSDSLWDLDNRELIIAKKVKNIEGDPTSLVVSHYWVDSATVAAGGGGVMKASAEAEDTDGAPEGDPEDEPEGDPEDEPEGDPEDEPESDDPVGGVIYYYETTIPLLKEDGTKIDDYSSYIDDKGNILFDELRFPSDDERVGQETEDHVFVKNVIGFLCTQSKMVEADSVGDPLGERYVSGEALKIQLVLKNETGDAWFNNSKEVFLRNQ